MIRDRVKAWVKTVFQVEHFAELNTSQFSNLYEKLPKFEQTIATEKQNHAEIKVITATVPSANDPITTTEGE
jgi:hypothetical protein